MSKKPTKKEFSLVDDIKNLLNEKVYIDKSSQSNNPEDSLYEVTPVNIEEFVTSKEYLGQNLYGLSEPQKKVLELADDFNNNINYLVLWVGKGGGKDFITRIIFLRLVYKLLCMRNPHAYFGLPSSELITFINVAASSDQAQNVFFEPLKNYIRNAGYKTFEYFGFNPDKDIKERMITFPKNILLLSGHSEADTLEGKNILVAVADEIDAKSFRNPQKMWTMLRSSSRSRFNGKEKIAAISYMRYSESNGMIKALYSEHLHRADSFVAKYPTWEFNPNPKITKETFASEYEANPEEAKTIYECDPPEQSIDAFIKDVQRLKNSMKSPEGRWPLKFPLPPEDFYSKPLTEATRVVEGEFIAIDPYNLDFHEWFKGKEGVEYIFVGDPGLGKVETGGDSFGITLGHREYIYDRYGNIITRPVVDFMFRFTGHMFKEKEIQFSAIQRLIEKLKDYLGFNIKYFYFDQWNSGSLGQWIRSKYGSNVNVTYSKYVTYEQYKLLKERIYGEAPPSSGEGSKLDNGGIDWFYHPIVFWEISNLVEDKEKGKVDHKEDTSKDIADTVATFVWLATRLPKGNIIHISGVPKGLLNDIQETSLLEEIPALKEMEKYIKNKKEELLRKMYGQHSNE
jgi:hypothetical protein